MLYYFIIPDRKITFWSSCLLNGWVLYQIFEVVKNKDTYILQQLDDTHLVDIFAGNWLKIFHPCRKLLLGDFATKIYHDKITNLDHPLSKKESETNDNLSDSSSGLDYILSFDFETLSGVPVDFYYL